MKKTYLLLVLLVFLGCATATVKSYKYKEDISFPATDPKNITVFQKKPEGVECIEIGEITVEGASSWNEVEKILKVKTGKLGGDAVYIFKIIEDYKRIIYPHDYYLHSGLYPYTSYYDKRKHSLLYPYGYYGPFPYHPYYGFNSWGDTVQFLTVVGIPIKCKE